MSTTTVPSKFFAVTLGTDDIAGQRAFYERWGWHAAPYSNDEYVAFDLTGTMVAFFVREMLKREAAPDAEERGASQGSGSSWNGITLALSVSNKDDVDSAWRAAVEAGARAVADPVDRPWGGRSGYVADPDGNRWEIAWIPPVAAGSEAS